MAVVASSPFFVQATIKVGTDEYTGHFQGFSLDTEPVTAEITDVGGTTYKFNGKSKYTLNVGVIQDWTATGLARKMYEDEGDPATITIETDQAIVTANVKLVAPSFGGQYGAVGVSQVALGVTGKPSIVDAA